MRKHVERASHDPKAVITTYEGKHNHDVPVARNSSHEFAGATQYKMRPQENSSSISLDLGVGIGRGENKSGDRAQGNNNPGSNAMVYDIVNGGLNLYGNRENRVVEAHNFQTPQTNQCQQNLGRILMGP